jgi:hypothetical protein
MSGIGPKSPYSSSWFFNKGPNLGFKLFKGKRETVDCIVREWRGIISKKNFEKKMVLIFKELLVGSKLLEEG